MSTLKWFDRKFDFGFGPDHYPFIYQRLEQAPERLKILIRSLESDKGDDGDEGDEGKEGKDGDGGRQGDRLVHKPGGLWSIKEHIGHLSMLEPVWRIRFRDIREKKPVLTPADLENKATSEAGFNEWAVAALLEKFGEERRATLALLNESGSEEDGLTSLHPRLQRPMRIIDLAYFVAEHDDHHLSVIRKMSGAG